MTSINDFLSPDLLFNIFKRLDCIETTRIRRVCKQWSEIVDEHKSFWRTLHLPLDSLKKWNPSILVLFDWKSGSTLQDVDIGLRVEREHQEQIINTLKKSRRSLKHLFLKFEYPVGTAAQDLLDSLSAVESLRVISWFDTGRVRLRRSSNIRDLQEDGSNTASRLRVLWYTVNRSILEISNDRFRNLASLDIAAALSASEWREILEVLSGSLKHLRFSFDKGRNEDHSGVPTLNFPSLEVLELDDGGRFPRWLLIPDSVKFIAHSDVSNLPSVSELWSWSPTSHKNDIVNRLPRLRTLCLSTVYDLDSGVEILNERKANVAAGVQVDGVKMEMIKTLILPLELSRAILSGELKKNLRRCRELVEVVEGNSESRFIEVEV